MITIARLYPKTCFSALSSQEKLGIESRDKASWYNTVTSRCKKQSTWYHSYLRLSKKGRRIHQCLGGKGTLINISLTGWFSSTTCISIYQSLSKKGRPIQCLGGKGTLINISLTGWFSSTTCISIYQSLSKKGRPIQCLGGKGGHITDGMFLMHNTISIYLIESIGEGKITRKM